MPKVVSTAIQCSPGVQRDGTAFAASAWLGAEWVRFVGQNPWKMGGLRTLQMTQSKTWRWAELAQYPQEGMINLIGIQQALIPFAEGTNPVVCSVPLQHALGEVSKGGQMMSVELAKAPPSWFWSCEDFSAALSPLAGYEYPVMYLAPFSPFFSETGAQLPPVVGSAVAQNVFVAQLMPFGQGIKVRQVIDPVMLEPVTTECGVGVINPGYVFLMYTNGVVIMNNPVAQDPCMTFSSTNSGISTWNEYVVGTTAVIACRSVMGNVPTGYFWTMDAVALCQIGEDNQPSLSTVGEGCSVMGQNTIVGVDGTFFWIGANCFYMLQGQVRELPNTMSGQWFFENVTRDVQGLSFGVYNRKYHEIWWFVPMFGARECNWALVFNVSTHAWYDTPMAEMSCGVDAQYTAGPLVAGVRYQPESGDISSIMAMEQGVDFVDAFGTPHPLRASLTSNFSSVYSQNTAMTESWISLKRLEMDLRMEGTLSTSMMAMHFPMDWKMGVGLEDQLAVMTEPQRGGAGDGARASGEYDVTQGVRYVDFSLQGRLVGLHFSMNCLGGDFRFGNLILDWTTGSGNSGGKHVVAAEDLGALSERLEEERGEE